MRTGRNVARSSQTVTHFPEVDVFIIRLNHVMVAMTKTNPNGSLDPPNSMTQTRNLATPPESSLRSESGFQNNMWTPKTIKPRTYIPMNPTGLGDFVRRTSSPSMSLNRFFIDSSLDASAVFSATSDSVIATSSA